MDSEQTNKEWRKGMEEYERERRRMSGMEKDAKQRAVIAGLTEDFVCLNYVDLTTDAYENTTIFRISDKLSSIIPGWATERNSRERFRLFSQYAVYEPDRERFIERTSQSLVLLHLQKNPAYFVNFRIRNGEDFSYTQMKFTADYAATGEIKGLVIGIHSIDEVKRHEMQRAEYMAVIASLADDFEFVGIIDKKRGDLTIYRASRVFENLSQFAKDGKIVGGQFSGILKQMVVAEELEEFSRKINREAILKALEETPVYKFEMRLMIDGQAQYYRIKFTQDMDNPDKLVIGLLNIDRQVRNEIAVGELEKELEYQNELREARDKAEAASKAKSAFLFNMSHNVLTPMNAIIGFADIAQKNVQDTAKVAESLRKIKTSSDLLLSLLNNILYISQMENSDVEVKENPVDLTRFMDDITPIMQPLAQAKNIEWRVEIGDLRNRLVYADTLHINQVVINLITNAVKYTHEGGTITLKLEQKECGQEGTGMYSITVADTGIGMSKEFMENIFESFSREDRWEVGNQEGVGLGLTIAERLVKLMNGGITVSSELGKGSTFVVTLPLRLQKTEEASPDGGKPSDESLNSLEGKKILLVEDNELNREIASEILEDFGMVVDTAGNGAKAVEMVLKHGMHYYDAIIMDINMPVMNGYEATKTIRSLPDDGKPVVIIALSANAFEEDKRKSLSVGMNAHIPKPIKVADLIGTLRKFI
ncbi:MAG: response regulator [Victivallales bacterium]|nr:response regulator [Victivallales bacterium]